MRSSWHLASALRKGDGHTVTERGMTDSRLKKQEMRISDMQQIREEEITTNEPSLTQQFYPCDVACFQLM